MRLVILFIISWIFTCNSQSPEPASKIVLVNIENLDRAGIAKIIERLNFLNPSVIAVDLRFDESKGDDDLLLINALNSCKSLVMCSMIHVFNDNDDKAFIQLGSNIEFSPSQKKTGFINVILEDDDLHTLRRFIVQQHNDFNGNIEYHFSVRTAMCVDSLKAIKFVADNPKIIDVDYKHGNRKFKKFSANDVLNKKITSNDIEGKIVLIGFLGPGDDDKFYTPLNRKKLPYKPDMYGLEYLANIVAQVLED